MSKDRKTVSDCRHLIHGCCGDRQDALDLLEEIQVQFCESNCPTVWKTGYPRPHADMCDRIAALLARIYG